MRGHKSLMWSERGRRGGRPPQQTDSRGVEKTWVLRAMAHRRTARAAPETFMVPSR